MEQTAPEDPAPEGDVATRRRGRPLHLRVHAAILVFWLLVALLFRIGKHSTGGTVARGMDVVSGVLKRALHWATGLAPVGVHELAIVVLILLALGWSVRALYEGAVRRRRWRHIAAGATLTVISAVCVIDALSGLVTGVYRRKLVDDLGWTQAVAPPEAAEPTEAELAVWCAELADAVNQEYVNWFKTEDIGEPSPPLARRALEEALAVGFQNAAEAWGLPEVHVQPYSPIKRTLVPKLLWYLGGYMSLQTQEAVYNPLAPSYTHPFIIAHEKAHQRGILTEDEANLLGFLACVYSENAYVRYSGYLCALGKTAAMLRAKAPESVDDIVDTLHPGAIKDIEAKPPAGWFENELRGAIEMAHDIILRYGGEQRGLSVYEDASLFILLARKNNGLVLRDDA